MWNEWVQTNKRGEEEKRRNLTLKFPAKNLNLNFHSTTYYQKQVIYSPANGKMSGFKDAFVSLGEYDILLFTLWKSNEEHGAFARDLTSFWKILFS